MKSDNGVVFKEVSSAIEMLEMALELCPIEGVGFGLTAEGKIVVAIFAGDKAIKMVTLTAKHARNLCELTSHFESMKLTGSGHASH